MRLTDPWVSYLVGLSQTDGHLRETTRNRGRLSIELARRDEELLLRLAQLIPYATHIDRRCRKTNFAERYESTVLSLHALEMRRRMKEWGVLVGKKSETIAPPSAPCSQVDYIRGLVDGDGSIGMTAGGFPFLSLNTSSDAIARYFVGFVHRATGKPEKRSRRNRRDDCFNICVSREDAVRIAQLIYYEGCICLERKRLAAEQVKFWVRPERTPRIWKVWTAGDDEVVRRLPIPEAARLLGRSRGSIYARRVELRRGKLSDGRRRILVTEWRQWTPDQDEFILAHSVGKSAEELGRTRTSIYSRRSTLRRQGQGSGVQRWPSPSTDSAAVASPNGHSSNP